MFLLWSSTHSFQNGRYNCHKNIALFVITLIGIATGSLTFQKQLSFVAAAATSLSIIAINEASSASPTLSGDKIDSNRTNDTTTTMTTTTATTTIYDQLQVQPPSSLAETSLVLKKLRRHAWKIHGWLLPILHYGIPDSYVNLRVLWNKALISLDPKSPAYNNCNNDCVQMATNDSNDDEDNENHSLMEPRISAYHMLPKYSRWILKVFQPYFPRWMHANIELRVVYLSQAIQHELDYYYSHSRQEMQNTNKTKKKIRLVTIGSGYDTRSLELLLQSSKYPIDEVWELDLPGVVESKQRLLRNWIKKESRTTNSRKKNTRREQQCGGGGEADNPLSMLLQDRYFLESIDLNDLDQLQTMLRKITRTTAKERNGNVDDNDNDEQQQQQQQQQEEYVNILLSEAVLLYLDKPNNVVPQLMQVASQYFDSICFADRFFFVDDGKYNEKDPRQTLEQWLTENGNWKLIDLKLKPGATRHLGIARSNVKT